MIAVHSSSRCRCAAALCAVFGDREKHPMETYARENAGAFPLSTLVMEKSTGVGITGVRES